MPASAELDIHRRLLTAAVNAVRPTPWEQIVPANLRFAARAAYFLLDAGEREAESFIPDAETFLTESLERLLRQLTRVTERQQVERHGQVRGRVLWSATYKARYVQDYDPGLFVCREVRREYDTPENQLLKHLLDCLGRCLRAVPATVRAGSGYFQERRDGRPLRSVADRLSRMEAAFTSWRHNARLREVTAPPRIEESHLLRAETSRTEEYGAVARLYRRYRAAVESPRWDGFEKVGRRLLLLPASAEDEVWIQIGAALLRA